MDSQNTASETAVDGPPAKATTNIKVYEHTGDLFAAPEYAVLVHACNTEGKWGAGIAAAFRKRYPDAYKVYQKHCLTTYNPKYNPVPTGTCLLIPPCEIDSTIPKHWIGCLFTSAKVGKAKDPPNVILSNTDRAICQLMMQVGRVDYREHSLGDMRLLGYTDHAPRIVEFRMCKINAGLFQVPWENTRRLLEGIIVDVGFLDEVHVYSPDDAASKGPMFPHLGERKAAKEPTLKHVVKK